MATKISRNDPCPCGSGIKYKLCCLFKEDNVIPFPGGKKSEDPFDQYRDMVESVDRGNGPVPTFMESQGTSNPATDVIKQLQEKIGDREFESDEDLQDYLNQHMNTLNSIGSPDFLGFSPEQMQSILYNRFTENSSVVELNGLVNFELFIHTPVYRQCLFLLQAVNESEKGLKATKKGNLPRSIVQEFYEKLVKEYDDFIGKPMMEDDILEIQKIRYFLTDNGLMKKLKGWFTLTKKGKKLLEDINPIELYSMLLVYFTESFNWLYGTGYSDEYQFIQSAAIFCFYILKIRADVFITGEELASSFSMAFPSFADDVDFDYDGFSHGFSFLFLERFAWYMGLVEMEKSEKFYNTEKSTFKNTELFKELFIWKV